MTPGAGEFVENIKHRELEQANSTILQGKTKQDTKAMLPWLKAPCRSGEK